MALFRYRAKDNNPEGHEDVGRVLARNKEEALSKISQQGLKAVSLKRVRGLAGFFGRFSADIR